MTLSVWVSFAFVSVMQTISPGPFVSLLISTGLRNGTKEALLLIPGAALGDFFLIVIAFAMTTALVAISGAIFDFIKITGGCYLIILGAVTIINCRNAVNNTENNKMLQNSFSQGLLTALLNPKGIIFFATLLPQFISPSADMSYNIQFAILGITYLAVGLMSDTFYALISSYGRRILTPRIRISLVIIAGISLLITGLYIIIKFMEWY